MVEGIGDNELVAAALKGSQEAFGELVARYRDAVFGAAFHRLGRFEEARDAAQEAFVKAYLHLGDLRKQESFANWLYHIADGTALDFARRPRREVALESVAEGALTDNTNGEQTEQSDLALQVREALSKLGESTRLAVILHYINGYSHAEVANFLGTSTGAVKTRISRAKNKLREEIEPMKKALKKAERLFESMTFTADGNITRSVTEAKSASELRKQLKEKGIQPCQIISIRSTTKEELEEQKRMDPITRLVLVILSSLFDHKGNCIKIWIPKELKETNGMAVSHRIDGRWHQQMSMPDYLWMPIAEKISQMAGTELQEGVAKRAGNIIFKYWGQKYQFKVTIETALMRMELPKNWKQESVAPQQKVSHAGSVFLYSVNSPQSHVFSGVEAARSAAELRQRLANENWTIIAYRNQSPQEREGYNRFYRRRNKESLQKILHQALQEGASSILIDYIVATRSQLSVFFITKGKKISLNSFPEIDFWYLMQVIAEMCDMELKGDWKTRTGRMSFPFKGKRWDFKVELRPRTIRIDRINLPGR